MSTMNSEIYVALIDAGSSEDKARAAAVLVTGYERDINNKRGQSPFMRPIRLYVIIHVLQSY